MELTTPTILSLRPTATKLFWLKNSFLSPVPWLQSTVDDIVMSRDELMSDGSRCE